MLLHRAGLRQNAFAAQIGAQANHVSQVLAGVKGPFNGHTQERIFEALKLSQFEREEMTRLAEISNRNFRLPKKAPSIEYHIAALLSERSTEIPNRFIEIAQLALQAHMAIHSAR